MPRGSGPRLPKPPRGLQLQRTCRQVLLRAVDRQGSHDQAIRRRRTGRAGRRSVVRRARRLEHAHLEGLPRFARGRRRGGQKPRREGFWHPDRRTDGPEKAHDDRPGPLRAAIRLHHVFAVRAGANQPDAASRTQSWSERDPRGGEDRPAIRRRRGISDNGGPWCATNSPKSSTGLHTPTTTRAAMPRSRGWPSPPTRH